MVDLQLHDNMYKPGQITSVTTKNGEKYLIRIIKVKDEIVPCQKCDFLIKDECFLSDEDQTRRLIKMPWDCSLKILRKCQQKEQV